jgi:hypothetical protein
MLHKLSGIFKHKPHLTAAEQNAARDYYVNTLLPVYSEVDDVLKGMAQSITEAKNENGAAIDTNNRLRKDFAKEAAESTAFEDLVNQGMHFERTLLKIPMGEDTGSKQQLYVQRNKFEYDLSHLASGTAIVEHLRKFYHDARKGFDANAQKQLGELPEEKEVPRAGA